MDGNQKKLWRPWEDKQEKAPQEAEPQRSHEAEAEQYQGAEIRDESEQKKRVW